jgi:putative NADH-flavin reductase
MEITVIGATGGTGLQVVEQALAAGHRVTAVVRNPAKLPSFPRASVSAGGPSSPGDLVVVKADVLSSAELRPVVAGRDAVITTLGPGGTSPEPIVTPALSALVEAMWEENATRVLLVSNSGMHTAGDPFVLRALVKPIVQRVLRHHYADARRAEDLLMSTDLKWTIARPPRLTNGPRRAYRTDPVANVRWGTTISRADLADFLLQAAPNPATIHQSTSLGY